MKYTGYVNEIDEDYRYDVEAENEVSAAKLIIFQWMRDCGLDNDDVTEVIHIGNNSYHVAIEFEPKVLVEKI